MPQQSVLEQLARLPTNEREAILAGLSADQANSLLYEWRGFHARQDQIAPESDWDIWLALAGRGWGKTRTGAEWVRERIAAGAKRIALIAETQKDLEEVMIAGESGILNVFPPDERPAVRYKPVRLAFPSGAVALGYNATEPSQLRGPQFDTAWCDELAKWRYGRETWDMLQFGMRLGDPKVMVTTTPTPTELVKALVAGKEGRVAVTRGSTFDNASNLPAKFLDKIRDRYEGTRLGRQELYAEILGDLPGALWTQSTLDAYRLKAQPDCSRIVVSVDPAASDNEDSDEHGIIVAGIKDMQGVVLEDASLQGSPSDWAKRAVSLYRSWKADAIVIEVNMGGDMVKHTLQTVDPNANIIEVRASRGKHIRAEPIAALYEQGKIAHVGAFPELEQQMTQMTTHGYEGDGSPDRLDAMVWAFTELFPGLTERVEPVVRSKPARRVGGWMT